MDLFGVLRELAVVVAVGRVDLRQDAEPVFVGSRPVSVPE